MPIHNKSGFTIVELLVVIAVIGILATVSIIAFNGVQQRALETLAKDTLGTGIEVLLAENIENGSFPETFPASFTTPPGVGAALTVTGSNDVFCMNVTSTRSDAIQYHAGVSQELEAGLCEESVRAESIIGDYNEGSAPEPPSIAGTMNSDASTFSAFTNEAWSELYISWDPVAETERYELQLRTSPTGVWSIRRILNEPTRPNVDATTSYQFDDRFSAQIPPETTNLTWAGRFAMPQTADAVFEYRLRAHLTGGQTTSWATGSLAAPTTASQPTIDTFDVTLSQAEDSITLSWNNADEYLTPSPIYEIQLRDSPTGTWMLRRILDDTSSPNAPISSYQANPDFSALIPGTTNEITWVGAPARPASGETFEYRIRVKSSHIQNLIGDWYTVQLSN